MVIWGTSIIDCFTWLVNAKPHAFGLPQKSLTTHCFLQYLNVKNFAPFYVDLTIFKLPDLFPYGLGDCPTLNYMKRLLGKSRRLRVFAYANWLRFLTVNVPTLTRKRKVWTFTWHTANQAQIVATHRKAADSFAFIAFSSSFLGCEMVYRRRWREHFPESIFCL